MSSTPLDVVVVGAGIGGLATAIALRRCGHKVKIYETSEIKTEVGAGISIQSNSLRVLNAFGLKRENLNPVNFLGFNTFHAVTGQGNSIMWHKTEDEKLRPLTCHRSDIHEELKRLATSADCDFLGPPAELHLGKKVNLCAPEAGSITLSTGEVVEADLVIGADGIHASSLSLLRTRITISQSVIRTSVLGHSLTANATGFACFRCLFDASAIDSIPELSWLREGTEGPMSVAPTGDRLSTHFMYFVRSGTVLNFAAFHQDTDQDAKPWTETTTVDDMRATYSSFHPKFQRIFDLPTVTPVLRWQLRAMPLLPTWIKGRTTIMGDAAHATLPLLGQGAAMAIEEAATLGCLLPLGTKREDVPARLAAFEKLRKERGEFVNTESVAQAMPEKRNKYIEERDIQAYLVGHDAIKAGEEYFNQHYKATS
ncbi:FAD/NAD(P)-binding domain-containing protein [Mycena kentingensis (nom. inval.)]|nr:FAD/NAD(P)-binding domain-containing protein [Mycena kentingensis (nom. inval.)]